MTLVSSPRGSTAGSRNPNSIPDNLDTAIESRYDVWRVIPAQAGILYYRNIVEAPRFCGDDETTI